MASPIASANVNGIHLSGTADSNQIGGTTAGERNVVSGNSNDGIRIDGATTTTIEDSFWSG